MAHRLLIVDDHARFRRSARRLLEIEGWDVVGEAGDGAEAMDAAGELRPDVVLLDVHLPDTTGFDVARALREQGASARVVLTSDRDAAEITPFVDECGACGFIPKDALSASAIESACFPAG